MTKTALLPTVTAVRMVWALTGKFSDDDASNTIALFVENGLKQIEDQALAPGADPAEKSYVTCAVATMNASQRSLDTIYKCRDLNFAENEKLRASYLESIKESLHFGSKARDFVKSLPTMTIGTAGGITIATALGLSGIYLWGLGLVLAALGYLVNLIFVMLARRKTQMFYVTQDYERGVYYDQYIKRVGNILLGLFLDLERIHKRVFGENYELDTDTGTLRNIIKDILVGVGSTFCPYAHKHMREKKITPELWTICESGDENAVVICPYWEGGQPQGQAQPGKVKLRP